MKANRNGFTLIEVLVSIVIIGLIITAVFNINIAGWKFLNYNQDRVDLKSQARLASTNLERKIRSSIEVESSNNSISDDGKNELVLSNGDTDNDGNTNYTVFYVESNRLKMGNINGAVNYSNLFNKRNIIDEVIQDYEFTVSDNLVYFYFDLEKDNVSYQISNKFYPRAK